MDMRKVANMADKIAAEEVNEPLVEIDQALDNIVAASEVIAEEISKVKASTPEQQAAIKQVIDILENAIEPYTSDLIEAMEKFEEEE
jgi:methyl-accepting chemotaxis protein